ncbi:MAG: radical SAM protein [Deltaproteobacteria bacterium]|nr:MAG: radical SAM protein [Deltaproteobacteria bacterium]
MAEETEAQTPNPKSCTLVRQDRHPGSCLTDDSGQRSLACEVTLRFCQGKWQRLITSIHLSRPENYLSIYQSGCNLSCRKCHSWYFSKAVKGHWMSPEDILEEARAYDAKVTLVEPRERITAWHAHESCYCCGACILTEKRSVRCPGVLEPGQIAYSSQGFGPARNIVAFTGGDLTCRPEFYAQCAQLIKRNTRLWVLIETNGYGLTPEHLDCFKAFGVDGFWLDIKAEDPERHRWLTGTDNQWILQLPEELLKRGFVLEVLSLYIPGVVEVEELGRIARRLAAWDTGIPFTILAFFPEYKLKDVRCPTVEEMVRAYEEARTAGLRRVRLGNLGVFVKSEAEYRYLEAHVDGSAL